MKKRRKNSERRCQFRGEGCLVWFEPKAVNQLYCDVCRRLAHNAQQRERDRKDPEAKRARARLYREGPKGKAAVANYRRTHREELNAARRRHRAENVEAARTASKITEAKPAIKTMRRRYVETHREQVNAAARRRWPKLAPAANAKRKKRYRKNRKNILAKLKQNRDQQRALVAEALVLKAKLAKGDPTVIGDLVVRPKGGRPSKKKKAARIAELAETAELAGRNSKDYWPDIQEKIFEEFGERTSIKGLQYLRRGHLRRPALAK
jgi:hypothetical protein